MAGGKIATFATGTSTNQTTWSDEALTIPNTNPLILDSAGRLQVQVFANASDVFAIQVKDSNDVVINATVDDVSFVSEFSLSSADVLSALNLNSEPLVLNGSALSGTALGNLVDDLTLGAAGSIDASAGAITLGTVTGATSFSNKVTLQDDLFITTAGSITAGATQTQAGATLLAAAYNRVTVVTTNGDGVRLPDLGAGVTVIIQNGDAGQTLQVWPFLGSNIDLIGTNLADTSQIAVAGVRAYFNFDGTNWFTLYGG